MISIIFSVLELIILVDCILSWVPSSSTDGIRDMLGTITRPLLEPFRELQYKLSPDLPLDLSPIFALIALRFIESLLYSILF